jgi:hypothetical protein
VVDNHDVEKALVRRDELLDEGLGEGRVGGTSLKRCSIRWGNFAEMKK